VIFIITWVQYRKLDDLLIPDADNDMTDSRRLAGAEPLFILC
jgi:hypothetical protein